ncbi:hypothetical protein BSLG_005832 [Batrachochytrium salamandrivorans]|nr:hypothetical protein BSLG_005832 [Batrachochytrium salamandrivorans]
MMHYLLGDETSSNPAEYEHYPLSETSSKSSSWSISQANPSALKVLSVSDTIFGYGSCGTIALELCSATLQDIIERCSIPQYDEMRRQLKPNHLLREIMAGVQHLH